jgi:hypothetical protein
MRAVIHDDDDLSWKHRAWTNRKPEMEFNVVIWCFQHDTSPCLDFITFKGTDRMKSITTKEMFLILTSVIR